MKSLSISKLGIFGEPRRTLWSSFHGLFVVMGKQIIYTYSRVSGEQKVVYGSDSNEFLDMDVSSEGYLVLVLRDMSSGIWTVKSLMPDFYSVAHSMTTDGRTVRKVTFVTGRIPLVASDSGDTGETTVTVFSLLQPYGEETNMTTMTNGHVVSIVHDKESDSTFAVTSGGDVWYVPASMKDNANSSSSESSLDSLHLAGIVNGAVSVAAGGLFATVQSDIPQGRVRIYVGSREWTNDMWDSGEIVTSLSTMPYGGGDNLKPGYRYWVHVMTWHSDSGWSKPQISSFLIPKE